MIPVVFREAARLDYVTAVRWYERRRAGLGAELAIEVRQALMAGREFPDRAPVVVEAGIRRIKVRRFPLTLSPSRSVLADECRSPQPSVWKIFYRRRCWTAALEGDISPYARRVSCPHPPTRRGPMSTSGFQSRADLSWQPPYPRLSPQDSPTPAPTHLRGPGSRLARAP